MVLQEYTGKDLEMKELGFNTLMQLLERVEGVKVMKPPDAGFLMVYGPTKKKKLATGMAAASSDGCLSSENEEVNCYARQCGCELTIVSKPVRASFYLYTFPPWYILPPPHIPPPLPPPVSLLHSSSSSLPLLPSSLPNHQAPWHLPTPSNPSLATR